MLAVMAMVNGAIQWITTGAEQAIEQEQSNEASYQR
jgi:hypothetical protein